MKRLREKLKSQSGASILLAILFFAVCAMAAASILMAASSNAGKIRNNREAQQRYLTLSSALNLICDELMQSSYTGKYDVVYTPAVYEDGKKVKDESYSFVQQKGEFASKMSGESGTSDVLPLRDELDLLYAKEFEKITGTNISGIPKNNGGITLAPHELTVIVEGHEDVKVTVELRDGYGILITAVLNENKMSAQLDIKAAPVVSTTITYSETDSNWVKQDNGTYIRSEKSSEVKWQLTWISKEVAAGSEIESGS